jgi:Leucine-rich repeat (LRR) protein
VINLQSNKITKIDVAAFFQLPKLKVLQLLGNECVDRNFETHHEIIEYFKTSNETCLVGDVQVCVFIESFFPFIGKIYYCEIMSDRHTEKEVQGLIGKHLENKNLKNVEGFVIAYKTYHEIPKNLENHIKSLKVLKITNSKLRKVHRPTLEKFENLQWINFEENEIEEIFIGTFEGNLVLKYLNLAKNFIKKIYLQEFLSFKGLEFLNLSENVCINEAFGCGLKNLSKFVEEMQKNSSQLICI